MICFQYAIFGQWTMCTKSYILHKTEDSQQTRSLYGWVNYLIVQEGGLLTDYLDPELLMCGDDGEGRRNGRMRVCLGDGGLALGNTEVKEMNAWQRCGWTTRGYIAVHYRKWNPGLFSFLRLSPVSGYGKSWHCNAVISYWTSYVTAMLLSSSWVKSWTFFCLCLLWIMPRSAFFHK